MKKEKIEKKYNPYGNEELAAWADIKKQTKERKVSIPSDRAVREAKEWVDDENQK